MSESVARSAGVLYVVATPIGNLKDISLRALTVLQEVDFIAAEDTRRSKQLLDHYGIEKPLQAYYDQVEKQRSGNLLHQIEQGKKIALISDGGTPLISDPGYVLVHEARKLGLHVVPIPGACACISALSVSGLAVDRFVFEGFLPAKAAARHKRLQELQYDDRTLIFYEAPHRLLETVADISTLLGTDRQICIARELTKQYEQIHTASAAALGDWLVADSNRCLGECVLLVEGAPTRAELPSTIALEPLLQELLKEMPVKKAVGIVQVATGIRKNDLYALALKLTS